MQCVKWEIIHTLSAEKNSGRRQTLPWLEWDQIFYTEAFRGIEVGATSHDFHLEFLLLENLSISRQRLDHNQYQNVCVGVFG